MLPKLAALLSLLSLPVLAKPNIVLFLADDLGYAEVGCYGQQKIKTPHIDQLAAEGMRFTQFYSGSPVCAPSRCTLLTGKHTGHTEVRDNQEMKPEGQWPIPADTKTLGNVLQDAGYVTACIGKWGLGGPGSTGEPNAHGFDHFYGHLCQAVAHNHYTDHVWRDRQRIDLEGNVKGNVVGKQYAPDLMADDAIAFIQANKDRPFFLYFATPLPHVSLQVPEDSLKPYLGVLEEGPIPGTRMADYTPHPTPHAAYAGMVSRLDSYLGRIMATLKELELDENTIVIFTSDNGPTITVGGADSKFFNSAGPLRGLKQDVYEGGIREPFIVRWPGRIKAGATSDLPGAFWDLMPTLAEITGATPLKDIDGVSIAPTLLGRGEQAKHAYFYWEYHSGGDAQAVRMGDWKAVRNKVRGHFEDAPIELYDLASDVGEAHDMAAQHPDIIAKMKEIFRSARTESDNPRWNFKVVGAKRGA
jgi:arylsulfatase A-like enzyme